MKRCLALIALCSMTAALPAAAQEAGSRELSFDAGIGAAYGSRYLGSDERKASKWLILRNLSVHQAGGGEGRAQGFSFGPSFDYIGKRNADSYDALKGMDDIDLAVELGGKVSYTTGPLTGYAALRKGFGGHHGLNGEFGAKYRIDPTEQVTMWLGAEAEFGDDAFTGTYFGVSPEEAGRTKYAAYDPNGGIYAASVGVQARYRMTADWSLLAEAKYKKLLGDAADSPIVADNEQPSVRVGVVRRFNFRF